MATTSPTLLVNRTKKTKSISSPLLLFISLIPWVSNAFIQIFNSGVVSRTTVQIQIGIYAIGVILCAVIWLLRRRYVEEIGLGILLLAHLFWFALPAFIRALGYESWFGEEHNIPVSNQVLQTTTFLVSLFFFLCIASCFLASPERKSNVPNYFTTNLSQLQIVLIVGVCLFVGIFPYLLNLSDPVELLNSIVAGRGDKAWVLSPGNARSYQGNTINTVFWISRAFLITAGVVAGSHLGNSKEKRSLGVILFYLFTIILAIFLIFFDQGTRGYLAILLIPVFLLNVLSVLLRYQNRISLAILVRALIVTLLLVFLSQYQLINRSEQNSQFDNLSFSELATQEDFFTETAYAVRVKNETSFTIPRYESPLLFAIVNPIPRVLWPNKPKSQIVWIYTYFRWDGHDMWKDGGNAFPSIVGQYYIMGRIISVAGIGLTFGLTAGWLNHIVNKRSIEHVAFALSALSVIFMSFRWFGPGLHYSALLLAGIIFLARNKRNKNNKPLLKIEPLDTQ